MLEQQVSGGNGMEVNEFSANCSLPLPQQAVSTNAGYSQFDQFIICPQALSSKTARRTRELMKKLKKDRQQCEPKRMVTMGKELETIAVV